ncbi:NUDIX domain-containing protein [Halovenus salina]|uniref:NUDIX domain-containing protein n=1 Tax=Halovenus salina TaxID=1510225 RepID=UPI002260D6EE|nr:NUDIX domain-containing protein [Halovenus salina]
MDSFRTVVKALITHDGEVLVGQKEPEPDHPIGGQWHIPGGHLAADEAVETVVEREVREETGLDVTVAELVDAMTFAWGTDGSKDSLQLLYHCRADSHDAKAGDDLQAVEWVDPTELTAYLCDEEATRLTQRPRQRAFVEELS